MTHVTDVIGNSKSPDIGGLGLNSKVSKQGPGNNRLESYNLENDHQRVGILQ